MKSASVLFLSAGAHAAAISSKHAAPAPGASSSSSDSCCFGLTSAGKVTEDVDENHVGDLTLGAAFQDSQFCIDSSANTITDSLGHNCFMRAPNYQFECYVGATGETVFDIANQSGGSQALVYTGGQGTFLACPTTANGDQFYDIFSTSKANTTGCLEVSLVLTDQNAACSSASGKKGAAPPPTSTDDSGADSTSADTASTDANGTSSATPGTVTANAGSQDAEPSVTPFSTRPTPTCSISPSAPSLGPSRIGFSDDSALDGIRDTGSNATITPDDNTLFEYAIPESFSSEAGQLCALQFRLPYCSDLPEGYPCYEFSGSEQELSGDSGMQFQPVDNEEHILWNNLAVHQVYPGNSVTIGTFACGTDSKAYNSETVTWLASSEKDFALEFLQADVGSDPQFTDGVGVWVVACS
ncbi:hypothetical protein BX600DRAFT_244576 [Xylariales sp. PMI_506]|nr:hypothetical protein BX600DRAFT_244576 [Xylariales sp. PMI_506]